jgi:hypothetical protein
MTEKGQIKIDRTISRHSNRFYKQLIKKEFPVPSLFELMMFRMGRTTRKIMLNEECVDFRYCRDKGWFDAPVRMGLFKKVIGKLFDFLGTKVVEKR